MAEPTNIEQATRFVRLEADLSHLSRTVDTGFGKMTAGLDDIRAVLDAHTRTLQTLTEARERQKSVTKWIAGIAAGVITAVLVALGVRKQ